MAKYVIAGGVALIIGLGLAVWLLSGGYSNCGNRCDAIPGIKQDIRDINAHLKVQEKRLAALKKARKGDRDNLLAAGLYVDCAVIIDRIEEEKSYLKGILQSAKTGFSEGPGARVRSGVTEECEVLD